MASTQPTPVYAVQQALAHLRAIEALLPDHPMSVETLPISSIRPNPFQARAPHTTMDQLAAALKARDVSIAFYVRPDPSAAGTYQLMCGQRWLAAAHAAHLQRVTCGIANYSDEELLEIGLLENLKLNILDTLEATFALRTLLAQGKHTTASLAHYLDTSEAHLRQQVGLAATPPPRPAPQAPAAPASPPVLADVNRDLQTIRAILTHWQTNNGYSQNEQRRITLALEMLLNDVRQMYSERVEPSP